MTGQIEDPDWLHLQSGEILDPQKKLRIARHECGHAFMAILCGQKVKGLSLKERDAPNGIDKYLGSMDLEAFERKPIITINDLNRKILISLAGFAGDGLFSDGLVTNFDSDDLEKAIKWVENLLENERFRSFAARLPAPAPITLKLAKNDLTSRYIDYMMDCCFKILVQLKFELQFVAGQLFEKEELTEEEVYALARQVGLDRVKFNVETVFTGVTLGVT